MIELSGVLEGRVLPVEVLEPSVDLGVVVPDHASTFEMASVNGIVSNNCRVQADIRLGQGVADEVVFAFEDVVEPSQGLVERFELSLVSLLLGRKAALVDSVIHCVVDPFVQLVDLLGQVLGVVRDALVLLIDEIVERSVEDTDDFGTLVVDNRLGLCVPDDRNGKSSIVVWMALK